MNDTEVLLAQIEQTCRRLGMAQTTFGRQAVNDGKFVGRLQQGGRVTMQTIERVHRFIEKQGGVTTNGMRAAIQGLRTEIRPEHNFRFYDNRQRYLMFINASSEKQIIADRAIQEFTDTQPSPPAIRIFDGGTGDGTVLARILRSMHRRHPWLPFYVVAKEISAENIRLSLEKMADRFQEHPATVLVMTNLKYPDAPQLTPRSPAAASAMVWHELALKGSTAGEFEEEINGLEGFLAKNWQASVSPRSGRKVCEKPAVLVVYRHDNRFPLAQVLPRRGYATGDFDLVLLSQAYRARAPLDIKASRVVAPLVRALRPGGKLMGVHSYGDDPGLEIIRAIWPQESPFVTTRHQLMGAVKGLLGEGARDFRFHALPDSRALFRYPTRILPDDIDDLTQNGRSTVFTAWSAACYVAQIEDRQMAAAMAKDPYLEATRDVLRRHRGLWFNDEMYIISRRSALG